MPTIGTTQLYDRTRSRMSELVGRADLLQTQISTGKKLTAASQDVAGWQRLQRINRAASDDAVYKANIALAGSALAQTDTTLAGVQSQLQRAIELATRAANDTMSPADRNAIAVELDQIVAELNTLAGAKDARGTPIFGTTVAELPIGAGQSVLATETADRAFGTGAANLMTVVSILSTALKGGGGSAASNTALAGLTAADGTVSAVRAAVGARAARVELVGERLVAIAADREADRIAIEDTDVPAAITELQKAMTALDATQASFSKLSQLSLFDYLR